MRDHYSVRYSPSAFTMAKSDGPDRDLFELMNLTIITVIDDDMKLDNGRCV